jgi:hypothetical protein
MHILCDTCSLIMLIRIEPQMLTDSKYGCVTARQVWEEFTQVTKFENKYPWRKKYKSLIRFLGQSKIDTGDYQLVLKAVKISAISQINERTGRSYGLSHTDLEIAAVAVAHDYNICSTDGSLVDFLEQQYETANATPLKIVNDWIKKGLIEWNDSRQAVIADWIKCNEKPQPTAEIKRFESLTGYKYPYD